jgi:hypothetical protein
VRSFTANLNSFLTSHGRLSTSLIHSRLVMNSEIGGIEGFAVLSNPRIVEKPDSSAETIQRQARRTPNPTRAPLAHPGIYKRNACADRKKGRRATFHRGKEWAAHSLPPRFFVRPRQPRHDSQLHVVETRRGTGRLLRRFAAPRSAA